MMLLGFGARGLAVERLQAGLRIDDDGIFGGETFDAMKAWQRKSGAAVTGECSEAEYATITGFELPTLFERCLAVTAALEGHGWGKPRIVASKDGIPDGAGITAGIIGFTTEYKSLQRVFDIAGGSTDILVVPGGIVGGLPRGQDAAIRKVLESERGKAAQVQVAREVYWRKAEEMAARNAFTSPWHYGLCFDIAVQNGSLSASFRSMPNADNRALELVKALVARVQRGKPEWAENVKARKMIFCRGDGEANGVHVRLPAWGLHR